MTEGQKIVRDLLSNWKLTPVEIAAYVGVGPTAIYRWHSAAQAPRFKNLCALQTLQKSLKKGDTPRVAEKSTRQRRRNGDVIAVVELVHDLNVGDRLEVVIGVLSELASVLTGNTGKR